MLTDNELLTIELRNRENEDGARLLAEYRALRDARWPSDHRRLRAHEPR